jgi:hypothetical protein
MKAGQKNERVNNAEHFVELGRAHAHLAHEVRRMLVTVGLLARSLLRDEELSDNGRESVNEIVEQVQAGEQLLDSVLELVTPLEDEPACEDAGDLLEEVRRGELPHAQETGVEIRLDKPDSPCHVNAVRGKLCQAVRNLAANAIDAMTETGGTLTLACRRREGDDVAITVQDDGPGMTDAQVRRMFKPFESSKKEGTGLGLALARKLVRDHAGSIDVDSRVGAGTTVTVLLPGAEQGTEE